MNDSDNLQPSEFGPTWPEYPPLDQLVRVTGGAVRGINPLVYPCLVIQFDPVTLTSRNRVAAYVVEPNNFALQAQAIYDTRLVGAFQGPADANPLPLFATTCCLTGAPSSSTSSAQSVPSCTVVYTACCPRGLPSSLCALFGGALAALGTVTLTWDGTYWSNVNLPGTTCGVTTVRLSCNSDESFHLEIIAGLIEVSLGMFFDYDCNNFALAGANIPILAGTCNGQTFSVFIRPC